MKARRIGVWAGVLLGCALIAFGDGADEAQEASAGTEPEATQQLDIQAMIDRTADNSSLFIPPGEHRLEKGLVIKDRKGLALLGGEDARILVEDLYDDVIRIERSEGIQLRNLYLRHVKPPEGYECNGSVLEISQGENIRIFGCELNGCGAIGVEAKDVRRLTVDNCYIHHNSRFAFSLRNCNGVHIYRSVVKNNASFGEIRGVDNMHMAHNIIHRNVKDIEYPYFPEPFDEKTDFVTFKYNPGKARPHMLVYPNLVDSVNRAGDLSESNVWSGLRIEAEIDGERVEAKVFNGEESWKAPLTLILERSKSYSFIVMCDKDGKRWESDYIEVTPEWEGTQERVAELKDVTDLEEVSALVASEEKEDDTESGEDAVHLFENQEPYKLTVGKGDTLDSIGKEYVVDPKRLRELNDLDSDEEVKPGQEILIPLD